MALPTSLPFLSSLPLPASSPPRPHRCQERVPSVTHRSDQSIGTGGVALLSRSRDWSHVLEKDIHALLVVRLDGGPGRGGEREGKRRGKGEGTEGIGERRKEKGKGREDGGKGERGEKEG